MLGDPAERISASDRFSLFSGSSVESLELRQSAETVQKRCSKQRVDEDDLVERAVFDLNRVGRGFDTPENGPRMRFYTVSANNGRSGLRSIAVVDRSLSAKRSCAGRD